MKKKTIATVKSQNEIAPGIYDLWLDTELARDAHAGQFVGVCPRDRSKLLPRPISICEVMTDTAAEIRLVYRVTGPDTGTADISGLRAGDDVELIGVLGNGYDVPYIAAHYVRPVLMGGGIGIPPMLELARELTSAYAGSGSGGSPTVILGYRDDETFLRKDFESAAMQGSLFLATEDGSVGTRGNVVPAFVSLEERMACGVGACLGCVVRTGETDPHSHVKNARICTEGPVFRTTDVEILKA